MSGVMLAMRQGSPRVLYDMNEGAGTTIWDYSGNGFNGTQSGTATYRHSNVVPGMAGLYLAASSYVSFTSDLNWGSGQAFSMSMWCLMPSFGASTACFLMGKGSTTANGRGVYVNPGGAHNITYYGSTANDEYAEPYSGGAVMTIGPNAMHLAFTISTGNVMRWYVNGVNVSVFYQVGPSYVTSSNPTATLTQRSNVGSERIGQQAGWYSSTPIVYGPFALYQAELSSAQITAHYLAGIRNGVVVGG